MELQTKIIPAGGANGAHSAHPIIREPDTIEATGLDFGLLLDLCLKTVYYAGRPSGRMVSRRMALPFVIIEELLTFLRRQEYTEIVGSAGINEPEYQHALTSKGITKAQEIVDRNNYVGPAPVPLETYVDVALRQSVLNIDFGPREMREAMGDLVLGNETEAAIGTAIGSGKSIFIYGAPGNGKTTIAVALGELLPGAVYVPHAVEVHGSIVRVYDPRTHVSLDGTAPDDDEPAHHLLSNDRTSHDRRWVLCKRPVVMAGGELTLNELDLSYSPTTKYYVAPLQMKANNGVLLIDDFGRQRIRVDELLNRWMVPMERRVDFLALETGETFEVPFDVLLLFATNLSPSRLGDEAFFRRIRHKVRIPDPEEDEFRNILRNSCSRTGVEYHEEAATYLIEKYYRDTERPFRGVHPRDLLDLVMDISKYRGERPAFTPDWIDRACRSYFVED